MSFRPSKLDGGNSTSTPLAGDATFTGVFIDVLKFASISVIINTDKAGVCHIEQSTNATDVDFTTSKDLAVSSVTNLAETVESIPVNGRYMRVKYVNGSAAQGHLRLQTVIQAIPLVPNNDPYDFRNSVKQGHIRGTAYAPITGHNPVVGTTFGTLAPFATNQIIDSIASAATVALASDDANDTSAGTGLRTVLLQGLDASGDEQTEVVVMNGQTEVVSANTYTSVHGLVGLAAGSGGKNAGRVTVGLGSDTFTAGIPDNDKYSAMEIGWNLGRTAYFTVPTGKIWYPDHVVFNASAGKTATVRVLGRQPGKLWVTFIEFAADNASVDIDVSSGNTQPAGTELRIDAKVNTGTGPVFCAVNYVLVDD